MARASRLPLVCCSGLKRSASTWSYNVCFELLRHKLKGRKTLMVGYAGETDLFLRDIMEKQTSEGARSFGLMKAHDIGPATLEKIRSGEVRNVYTVRDPRDAFSSMLRFWPPRESFGQDRMIRQFQKAMVLGETFLNDGVSLVLRYEEVVAAPEAHIARIAQYLGVAPNETLVAKVHAATSVEHVAAFTEELRSDPKNGRYGFDERTQYHGNHLDGGKVGRWRDDLPAELQDRVNTAFMPWLLSFGYDDDAMRQTLQRIASEKRSPASS